MNMNFVKNYKMVTSTHCTEEYFLNLSFYYCYTTRVVLKNAFSIGFHCLYVAELLIAI